MITLPQDHSRLINKIAKAKLTPAGFRQKGRSRFWYDDRAWCANFVDFQPSSWSKGTYCNVGVTWLWEPTAGVKGYWAFHVVQRVAADSGQFVSYENNPAAFESAIEEMADRALVEAKAFRRRFDDVSAVAAFYTVGAVRGWPGYHRAISLGLTGSGAAAQDLFVQVATDAEPSQIEWIQELGRSARWLADIATDRGRFTQTIEDQITQVRETLRLPQLHGRALPFNA